MKKPIAPPAALDLFPTPPPPPPLAPMAPNKRRWNKGDLVLHARDPKHKEMLLRVDGYRSATHAECRFVSNRYAGNGEARKNRHAMAATQIIALVHLHDPRRFGITVSNAEDDRFPVQPVDVSASGKSAQVFTDKLIFGAQDCAAQSEDTRA